MTRRRQSGLSLIELMISITLGLLIVAALVAVFSQNSQSFRQNDANAEMQDNARFALDVLSRDLSMAGYFGGVYDGSTIQTSSTSPNTVLPLTTDCETAPAPGWAFLAINRIEFDNNHGSNIFNCLDRNSSPAAVTDTPVIPNTDVVAIKRSAGQSSADFLAGATSIPRLCGPAFMLQSNGTQSTIIYNGPSGCAGFQINSTDVPTYPPMSFYKWVPRVYFIRKFSHDPNENPQIPALCRMELQYNGAPTMQVECIADGIENLQIEWGLDTDTTPNCVPDTYTSNINLGTVNNGLTANPTANQIVTARIWLIARTNQPDGGYTDTKTFNIGDVATIGPANDHYHRRVYTTTVQLRNPVGSVGPCSPPPTR